MLPESSIEDIIKRKWANFCTLFDISEKDKPIRELLFRKFCGAAYLSAIGKVSVEDFNDSLLTKDQFAGAALVFGSRCGKLIRRMDLESRLTERFMCSLVMLN